MAALCGLALVVAGGIVLARGAEEDGWRETFDSGSLDLSRWVRTRDGDFREHLVDVVASPSGVPGFRLRLRADTRGTRDDTVKFLGARTVETFPTVDGTRLSVTLDWNDQANGSYLSAAVILAPAATAANPLLSPDWLKVEYVGVPPGRKVRRVVSSCVGGREQTLDAEGWPDNNRAGRRVGRLRLSLVWRGGLILIDEDGERRLEAEQGSIPLKRAHVYLQLSSHSNYPPREIFFDDLNVIAAR